MTAHYNYDNSALSTGITVGAIAADFEAQVLANRKRVLMNAAQAADFRSSVYQQIIAFNNANREAAQKAAAEAIGFAQREMERAYNAGRARIDQNVRAYERQGYRAEEHKTHSDFLLNAAMYTVAGGISGAINTALESAHSQLLGVAALVNTDSGDIYREIDRVQANYLRKGLSGAHRVGGSKMELSSAVELQVRDDSQRTLLKAQGERSLEYGLYLIQISAHPSSCPLCLPWQTRVLIDDVNNDGKADGKHELLSTAMSAGLYHYNCRHSYIVYIEGYSRNDIFDYDRASKELTADRYATEQEQRYNERQIRQWKRVEAGAVSEKEREFAAQKKQLWQLRQRELEKYAELNNLPFYRQYPREAIGGKTESVIPEITQTAKEQGIVQTVSKNERIWDKTIADRLSKVTALEDKQVILREYIVRGEISLKINVNKQNNHIVGTKNYNTRIEKGPPPSILTYDNPQELVNTYAGHGRMLFDNNKNWIKKEAFTNDTPIGYTVNTQGEMTLTKKGILHYSYSGTHIVPGREDK